MKYGDNRYEEQDVHPTAKLWLKHSCKEETASEESIIKVPRIRWGARGTDTENLEDVFLNLREKYNYIPILS